MAAFRADFGAATRAFVRRIAGPDADPDLVDWVAEDMGAAPPQIALNAMRHAITNERAAIVGLRDAAVPAVAINPADGRIDAGSLARHGVEAVAVSGVGHFLMLEDPVGFNRVLDRVLERFLAR
jgi:pimeloyl-ACP methyl ester carboxylesterase